MSLVFFAVIGLIFYAVACIPQAKQGHPMNANDLLAQALKVGLFFLLILIAVWLAVHVAA